MVDVKKSVEKLIFEIEKGEIPPEKAWDEIKELKELYVKNYSEQSWHSCYFNRLKSENPQYNGLTVFKENEVKGNEIIARKLAIKYGEYLLLPDTDMAIVDYNFEEPWKSEILAIISCKTSLRERIAQACYWKLKLLSSDVTKNVRVFLATTDNDEDFFIKSKRKQYEGKHRNRIIAEYELDGVYILREDFKKDWESDKIKRYNAIFEDLIKLFTNVHKG